MNSDFTNEERAAVYKAIFARRDIRMYKPTPIPSESLYRILQAGHSAGSVGMMQPWNFILLDDADKRTKVHQHFVYNPTIGNRTAPGEECHPALSV